MMTAMRMTMFRSICDPLRGLMQSYERRYRDLQGLTCVSASLLLAMVLPMALCLRLRLQLPSWAKYSMLALLVLFLLGFIVAVLWRDHCRRQAQELRSIEADLLASAIEEPGAETEQQISALRRYVEDRLRRAGLLKAYVVRSRVDTKSAGV